MPDANKAVMLCNRMAFAYTGMAVLESQPTSVWLWDVIKELKNRCSTSDVVKHVAKRAAVAVARANPQHYPKDRRRQTFVGVGFAALGGDNNLSPIMVRITNCHDRFGQRMKLPAKEFAVQPIIYRDRRSGWAETGMPLEPEERTSLARAMRECAKHGTGTAAPIRLFCETIWKVHRRVPKGVSDNILIVMLPRSAALRHTISLFTDQGGTRAGVRFVTKGCKQAEEPLRPEHMAMFAYIPRQGEQPIQYGPLMACPGRGAVSGLTIDRKKP